MKSSGFRIARRLLQPQLRSVSTTTSRVSATTSAEAVPVAGQIPEWTKETSNTGNRLEGSQEDFQPQTYQPVASIQPESRIASLPYQSDLSSRALPKRRKHASTEDYLKSCNWLDNVNDFTITWHEGDHTQVSHIELWSQTQGFKREISALALRDNCACNTCRHPVTKQRQLDSFSIPIDITPESWRQLHDGLHISWSDGHQSHFTREWLEGLSRPLRASRIWPHRYRRWFDPNGLEEPPSVPYESVMNTNDGLKQYLNRIGEYGFCFVDDCPIDPKATQELLERISFVRVTHYGGFYDFTADLSSKDTAYTNIALEPHNDNTYFTDPAGLQMLHLLSHTDGEGGLSTLVDGFKAADVIMRESPKDYSTLCLTRVYAHASGDPEVGSITPTKSGGDSVIVSQRGTHKKIRWNNSDRNEIQTQNKTPAEEIAWYEAARRFNSIVNSDKYLWKFQLKPGRPLIFDNWRMLHGRIAFTGKRRMAGGYINMDDFVAKWKQLNLGEERISRSL